jgi:DNA-binding transcriptional MerR regulator
MSDGKRSMGPSKIGDLARRAGCTVKTVRFYEASGLLPRAARSPSGYRLYTELDVRWRSSSAPS